jgi:hypothetical protein
VSELSALPELIGSIMLQGETGRCSALRQRVEKVERLKDRAGELGEKLVELSIARAGLGVVPVNSDEMASQIDAMAEFFDIIEAGIQQHRATLNSICPESSELSDHAEPLCTLRDDPGVNHAPFVCTRSRLGLRHVPRRAAEDGARRHH